MQKKVTGRMRFHVFDLLLSLTLPSGCFSQLQTWALCCDEVLDIAGDAITV